MAGLSPLELELIHLGITKNGTFNETDIAESSLSRLGVGKLLDLLASLEGQELIRLNKDGSFTVTTAARQILWDDDIPDKVRILRFLQTRPAGPEEISRILGMPAATVSKEIEKLRKDHHVLMSGIQRDGRLEKTYEILPDGAEALKTMAGMTQGHESSTQAAQAIKLLDEIISEIVDSGTASGHTMEKLHTLRKILSGSA